MRASNILSFTHNYSSGFDDVYRHETAGKTLIGLLKIISYALILPPLILGCMYLKSKKINDLQTDIDSKIDTNKVLEVFSKAVLEKQGNCQKKMIQYLINKLNNFEKTDDELKEKARFEQGFKQLTFDFQQEFFKKANEEGCLEMALQWTPKDITELNFISGPPNALRHSDISNRNMVYLLAELPKFTQLKKITLNLQGLGFYGESVDLDVQRMTVPGVVFGCRADETRYFQVHGMEYGHYNDTLNIVKTLVEVRKLIKNFPNLEWELKFMTRIISGKGTELTEVLGGEMMHGTNLVAYFNKP